MESPETATTGLRTAIPFNRILLYVLYMTCFLFYQCHTQECWCHKVGLAHDPKLTVLTNVLKVEKQILSLLPRPQSTDREWMS